MPLLRNVASRLLPATLLVACAGADLEGTEEPAAVTAQPLASQGNGVSPTTYGFASVANASAAPGAPAFATRCTATIVSPYWLVTSRTCTSRRAAFAPGEPAATSALSVNGAATVAELIWHPTVDVALVRLQQPLAGAFNRYFYRGAAAGYQGFRLDCFGFHFGGLSELHRGSFVVTDPRGSLFDLVDGRSTDPAYSPPNVAWVEASDSGGACVTWDGQIVGIIQSESLYDPSRGKYVAVATKVDSFAEWAIDTMELVDNRRLRSPVTLRAASTSNCMDIPYGTAVEGGPINQFSCHSQLNQQFFQEPLPTGGTRIVSAATGKCLEATSYLGGTIVQRSCEARRSGQTFAVFAYGGGAMIRPSSDPLGTSCVFATPGLSQLRSSTCPLSASPWWTISTP